MIRPFAYLFLISGVNGDSEKDFDNLVKWWKVGKTQIKIFCQQYTAHTTAIDRNCFEELEKEIMILEDGIINGIDNNNDNNDNSENDDNDDNNNNDKKKKICRIGGKL